MKITLLERFWLKVDISNRDGCWNWTRAKNHAGYGQFSIATGVYELSHRISWELMNGCIPKGLFVLHKCDNPACVNPYHLFLGTQQDNMADMKSKGRNHRPNHHGIKNPNARLTEQQVKDIRIKTQCYTHGLYSRLAREYGVRHITISQIAKGDSWN